MECCYCKKKYSNQYTLKTHQTTTKSCILIQQNKEKIKDFSCSFCNKTLSSKLRLDHHLIICKIKMKIEVEKRITDEKEDELEEVTAVLRNQKEELEYELKKIINEKDREIKELKDRLEKTPNKTINKNKTQNITNNITNNILTIYEVMTPERVEDFFKKHYNLDTLLEGMSGLARFICDGFIREKSNYICTDRSRYKFMLKDEHGNSVEDTNCEQLVSLTAPGMPHIKDVYETGLFTKHEDITTEDIHTSYQPISNLDKDSSPFKSELSKIIPSEQVKRVKNDDWKKTFEMMRESYERNRKCDKIETEKETETELPVANMIGGFSLGTLQRYKDGYKQRKEKANGKEVEIKGPKLLLEYCNQDETIKKQYIDFITN